METGAVAAAAGGGEGGEAGKKMAVNFQSVEYRFGIF